MAINVAIAGATGYAGGEIIRLLLGHPKYASGELTIGALMGNSSAGQRCATAIPHAPQLAHRVIEAMNTDILAQHDVVFLGLPHGHSATVAKAVGDRAIVVDCAADFRLKHQTDWDNYYGGTYAGSWPYGIPELPGHREAIAASKHVAVPGCFPTGATLATYPALQNGFIEPNISITSVTGVSGAGKSASVPMLGAETMGSLKAYKTAGTHRHTPEIIQNLEEVSGGKKVNISFTPVLAPLPRGILTVASAPLSDTIMNKTKDVVAAVDCPDKNISQNVHPAHTQIVTEQIRDITAQIRGTYEDAYAKEACVHLLEEGIQPQTQHVLGANLCHVQVEVDSQSGRLLMVSAIDNLTKGTAGAAIQCMNIALGWEETAGLPLVGVAP